MTEVVCEPRRVQDKVLGDRGTAVADLGKGRWRVEWDRPTAWQEKAAPRIPGPFFEWV